MGYPRAQTSVRDMVPCPREYALCYLVGAATNGVGALAIAAYAWHRRNKCLALHALQSFFLGFPLALGASVYAITVLAILFPPILIGVDDAEQVDRLDMWLLGGTGIIVAAYFLMHLIAVVSILTRGRFRLPLLGAGLLRATERQENAIAGAQLWDWRWFAYALASFSFWLGPLLVFWYARRKGSVSVLFDAGQAAVWNLAVFLLAHFVPLGLMTSFIVFLTLTDGYGAGSVVPLNLLIIFLVPLGVILNMAFNLWATWQVLQGRRFLYPFFGKWFLGYAGTP